MNKWVLGLILLAVIGIFLLFHFSTTNPRQETPKPGNPNTSLAVSNPVSPPFSSNTLGLTKTHAPSQSVTPNPVSAAPSVTPYLLGSADTAPSMEPATVLGNMRRAINQYRSMFGSNPVGTNPEITSALNGENPKQARLVDPDAGLRINGRGELVDYWGTPFFFHQLSGIQMEIRSAGPDHKMWTRDDLIVR
jgi:hypothetical protein